MVKLLRAFVCGAVLLFAAAMSLAQAQPKYRIVVMPKLVGIAYYDAVKTGIDAAAKELPDVAVTWTGPTQDQVEKQIEMIERLIPTKPDLIAVAANDPVAIVPVLAKAQQAGIRVMSWDGDSNQREFFVNLVDFEEFGAQLVETMSREVGAKGDIAIVTTSFTAPESDELDRRDEAHHLRQVPGPAHRRHSPCRREHRRGLPDRAGLL